MNKDEKRIFEFGLKAVIAGLGLHHLIDKQIEKKPRKAYRPAGPYCNVNGTFVKNPKQAAQMNAMWGE